MPNTCFRKLPTQQLPAISEAIELWLAFLPDDLLYYVDVSEHPWQEVNKPPVRVDSENSPIGGGVFLFLDIS